MFEMEDTSKGYVSVSSARQSILPYTNDDQPVPRCHISRNVTLIFLVVVVFSAIVICCTVTIKTIALLILILVIILTYNHFNIFKSKTEEVSPSLVEDREGNSPLNELKARCEKVESEKLSTPFTNPQYMYDGTSVSRGYISRNETLFFLLGVFSGIVICCTVSKETIALVISILVVILTYCYFSNPKTKTEEINSTPEAIFLLPLQEVSKHQICMLRKCELGTRISGKQEKVIMVVGATGTGKTKLINGMINYVLGVKWEDDFRFEIVLNGNEKKLPSDATSQTKWINAYTIHHDSYFRIPFTLTIIDTPTFDDKLGIEHDKEIMKQISEFFHTKGAGGINCLTAICIVVSSTAASLTDAQKFFFDVVLSLFGKDIGQNILLMITFSNEEIPPVLAAITKAGFPYRKYFKFNSLLAQYSASNKKINNDAGCHCMFSKLDSKSFEKFFEHVRHMENKSLQLTKGVLSERKSLESFVEEFHLQLKAGLSQLEQYKKEVAVLRKHEKDIELNKNFTYDVTEDIRVKKDIPKGRHTTTCLKCYFTCHDSCAYANDADKINCVAMNNGSCTRCLGRCYWQNHKNMPYLITIERKTKTKTANDLKQRYEKAVQGKITAQVLIDEVSKDFLAVQINILYLTDQIRKSLARLDQMALRRNPMTVVEYIDVLIKSENKERKIGWNERVRQLEAVRAQAEIIYNLGDENFDPFSQYGKAHQEIMEKGGDKIQALRKLQGKLKFDGKDIFNTVRNFLESWR